MVDLGLTCQVEDILDVAQFRHDFLFGLVLQAATKDGDYVAAWQGWTVAPESFPPPKTAEEAANIVRNVLFGNIPDNAVLAHLTMQLSRLSLTLGMRLDVQRVASLPLDASSGEYDAIGTRFPWVTTNITNGRMRVEIPGPILSVGRVRGLYSDGSLAFNVAGSSVSILDKRIGIISVPLSQDRAGVEYGASNLFASALRFEALDTIPDFWAVDYVTGPAFAGRSGSVPSAIKFHVWCQTAKFMLALHSNVTTKGISNQSRSIDGLSNSVSLTNTAMYDVNSALEIILDKYGELVDTKVLRRSMRGIPCVGL